MRAWQITRYGEPREALALVDVPLPEPGPGELRVRVVAAGLGLPDVLMCRGSYAYRPTLPFTPGQEVVGVVTAAGEGADTALGTLVMGVTAFFRGFGGFAAEALVLDGSAFRVPKAMPAQVAAGFTIPYHTAHLGLVTRGRLVAGQSLVVLGAAGGSGTAAVSLGVALGLRVIAVARGPEKADAVAALGADAVVDAAASDWVAQVRGFTDGRGADAIYDPVGGELSRQALDALANEGTLLAVGFASGDWHACSAGELVARNVSVVGVFAGAYHKPFTSELHESLLSEWQAGRIRPGASTQVSFDALPEGLQAIADRRATGKWVMSA